MKLRVSGGVTLDQVTGPGVLSDEEDVVAALLDSDATLEFVLELPKYLADPFVDLQLAVLYPLFPRSAPSPHLHLRCRRAPPPPLQPAPPGDRHLHAPLQGARRLRRHAVAGADRRRAARLRAAAAAAREPAGHRGGAARHLPHRVLQHLLHRPARPPREREAAPAPPQLPHQVAAPPPQPAQPHQPRRRHAPRGSARLGAERRGAAGARGSSSCSAPCRSSSTSSTRCSISSTCCPPSGAPRT